jgi:UDP-N-acetylmuramate dehydrogenase
VRIAEKVLLAPFTTLRIGGPARFLARATTLDEVRTALSFARERSRKVFVLGGGSNLVVPDEGFDGLVLHAALTPSIVRSEAGDRILFDVSAGTDWDAFVLEVCRQGVCGVECLAGIPGLTGGTPVQNVGAYGQEVAQTVVSVTVLDLHDPESAPRVLAAAECGFAYRRSRFNSTERGRWLVLAVRFGLDRQARPNLAYGDLKPLLGTDPTPLDVYHFVRKVRAGKGMLIDPANPEPDSRSAGSFFKNPVVPAALVPQIAATLAVPVESIPQWPVGEGCVKLAAAWLIDRAGFPKGFALGAVGISSRHTLALINRTGDATCADLLRLRDHLAAGVQARFGVALEQEPVFPQGK